MLGAFSVQGERYALSVLAFLLVLCVLRGGRRFFRLEVRYESLELSTASSTFKPNLPTSKIQSLTSIILNN
ncbi:hypothetical protein FO597_09775 [Riemerella anatipestifer]|nr:hypothetical protein G148_0002 [Riemerella anatipestifer RA-CH-2]AKP69880.1 hypothetical protein CG08_1734 [Riemerella anatipestifer]AKP71844.1 hypothetical protein CG09_1711 [Riemerella anatipestifer]MDD1598805.1 hypothetical protein [Riemerella anatipestifer]MSN85347.1 hypothetical protein [Riemerella anatipestifer]